MINSKFMDWINVSTLLIKENINKPEIKCPECKQPSIDYQYVGDVLSRVGFLDIWCNSCLRGIHVSRTKAPEQLSMISFEDVDEYKNRVPKYTPIEPQ